MSRSSRTQRSARYRVGTTAVNSLLRGRANRSVPQRACRSLASLIHGCSGRPTRTSEPGSSPTSADSSGEPPKTSGSRCPRSPRAVSGPRGRRGVRGIRTFAPARTACPGGPAVQRAASLRHLRTGRPGPPDHRRIAGAPARGGGRCATDHHAGVAPRPRTRNRPPMPRSIPGPTCVAPPTLGTTQYGRCRASQRYPCPLGR